jgi:hypothetical protein
MLMGGAAPQGATAGARVFFGALYEPNGFWTLDVVR